MKNSVLSGIAKIAIAGISGNLLLTSPVYAETYPYMDSTGKVHYNAQVSKHLVKKGNFKKKTYVDKEGYGYTVVIKIKNVNRN